jgi:hypothetical protein
MRAGFWVVFSPIPKKIPNYTHFPMPHGWRDTIWQIGAVF